MLSLSHFNANKGGGGYGYAVAELVIKGGPVGHNNIGAEEVLRQIARLHHVKLVADPLKPEDGSDGDSALQKLHAAFEVLGFEGNPCLGTAVC